MKYLTELKKELEYYDETNEESFSNILNLYGEYCIENKTNINIDNFQSNTDLIYQTFFNVLEKYYKNHKQLFMTLKFNKLIVSFNKTYNNFIEYEYILDNIKLLKILEQLILEINQTYTNFEYGCLFFYIQLFKVKLN